MDTTLLEVIKHDELWEDVEPFQPILVVMILEGHLEVKTPDLALGYFGSLLAYVLEFVITFLRQTNWGFKGTSHNRPRLPVPIHENPTTLGF